MASRLEREFMEVLGRDTFNTVFQWLDSCEEVDTDTAGLCAANACFAVMRTLDEYFSDESV